MLYLHQGSFTYSSKKYSLLGRILITTLTLIGIIVSLVIFVFEALSSEYDREITVLHREMDNKIRFFDEKFNSHISVLEAFESVLVEYNSVLFDETLNGEIKNRMKNVQEETDLSVLAVAKSDGTLVSTDINKEIEDFGARYLEAAVNGEEGIGVTADRENVIVYIPAKLSENETGAVFGTYDKKTFFKCFNINNSEEGSFHFTDGDGVAFAETKVFFGSDSIPSYLWQNGDNEDAYSELNNKLAANIGGVLSFELENKKCVLMYSPLGNGELFAFNLLDKSTLVAKAADAMFSVSMLCVAVVICSVIYLVYIHYLHSKEKRSFKAEEEILKQNEELYRTVVDMAGGAVFEADVVTGAIKYKEEKYRELFGHNPFILNFNEFKNVNSFVFGYDSNQWRGIAQAFDERVPKASFEYRLSPNRDGIYSWRRLEFWILNTNGTPYRLIGRISDIDDEKRNLDIFREKLETDPNTRFLKPDATKRRIERLLEETQAGEKNAFLLIDVKPLKNERERNVLRSVSARLKKMLVVDSILGISEKNEVIVFLTDIQSSNIVTVIAARICDGIQALKNANMGNCRLSCKIGIALSAGGKETYEKLYSNASNALSKAIDSETENYAFEDGVEHSLLVGEFDNSGNDVFESSRLHALLEHINGGVFLLQVGERIKPIYISSSYYSMAGFAYEQNNGISDDFLAAVHPDDANELYEKMVYGIENNSIIDVVYRVVFKDSDTFAWRHLRAIQIPYKNSSLPVVIAVSMDVTELKEAALSFNALIDNIPGGIGIFEVSGRLDLKFASEGMKRMFLCFDELKNQLYDNLLDAIHESDREGFIKELNNAITEKRAVEYTFKTSERYFKEARMMMVRAVLTGDNNGNPLMIAIFTDLTNQFELRDALNQKDDYVKLGDQYLRLAFNHSKAQLWTCDLKTGEVSIWNTPRIADVQVQKYYGFPGLAITEKMIHPDGVFDLMTFADELRSGRSSAETALLVRTLDNEYAWHKLACVVQHSEDGVPERAIGVLECITPSPEIGTKYDFEDNLFSATEEESIIRAKVNVTLGEIETYSVHEKFVGAPLQVNAEELYAYMSGLTSEEGTACITRERLLNAHICGYKSYEYTVKINEKMFALSVSYACEGESSNVYAFFTLKFVNEFGMANKMTELSQKRNAATGLMNYDALKETAERFAEGNIGIALIEIVGITEIESLFGEAVSSKFKYSASKLFRVLLENTCLLGFENNTLAIVYTKADSLDDVTSKTREAVSRMQSIKHLTGLKGDLHYHVGVSFGNIKNNGFEELFKNAENAVTKTRNFENNDNFTVFSDEE